MDWCEGPIVRLTRLTTLNDAALCCGAHEPIAVPAVAFVLSLFLMPETRERSIWDEAATAQKA
jgi:hypothetical protein